MTRSSHILEKPSLHDITIIAAMARNRAIGMAGAMPWHLPRELKHFKERTMGKPIVMGRKTWESIGRALPGRQNIVVTRNRKYQAGSCLLVRSLREAMEYARGDEVMIIGGGQLYAEALPLSTRMILTLVNCEPEADTWFPAWNEANWREISRRCEPADENNGYDYEVVELVRKINASATTQTSDPC
jgi:dihydrofolate reductase